MHATLSNMGVTIEHAITQTTSKPERNFADFYTHEFWPMKPNTP
jgi:hypothetical protein